MQKLLIVIAIQFCLPLAVELVQNSLPVRMPWQLGIVAGLMNMVCLGCALTLWWPRWHLMLLVLLTTCLYWGSWSEFYVAGFRQVSSERFLFQYYKYFCGTVLLTSSFALLLFNRQTLLWQPRIKKFPPQRSNWQIKLGDLIYYMSILVIVLGMVSVLYRERRLREQDSTAIFGLVDFWLIALTMTLCYHGLQRTIRWLNVGLSVVLLAALWFARGVVLENPDDILASLLFLVSSLGLGSFSILLYRWAGFRIVPRQESLANPQPTAGPHSCKNC